ncbi:MAG TPA: response regulator [Stellaceae bacterium]|nr:response regulator [Stellaceae bacterium]
MSDPVLVVDDSLTVRMDLMATLGDAGLASTARATIAEARDALAGGTFALVILDVLLPDGDGIDLLREIRETPSTRATPVMLLSTESEVADRVRGMTTGADEYVGKPYERSYLVARARALIDRTAGSAAVSHRVAILVIDDSVTFREALRGVLEAASFRVVVASSGEEGLQVAARERPAAIIVDGVLPGLDGAAVIRTMRLDAALRSTPCLLLTGSEDASAELRALDSGADAFVHKEEDTRVILARLTAMLRSAGTGPNRRATASLHAPKRLLTVDDSDTYLQALAEALRGAGYEIVSARTGEQALQLLAVQPVDCILLDLQMPGIGGEETCRRIKAAPTLRDTPIVMLTSLEDREAMIRGLGAGADDYIAKSSDFEVVRARVLAQLRRKQFEDESRFVREELLRRELEATEAQAARQVAETRAALAEEQKIRTQMERAAALLEAAPDPVVIVDEAARITMVNARTEDVFGYPRGELLGQPIELLIPLRLRTEFDAAVAEPPAARELELLARRKDGSEFPAAVSLSPLTAPEGTLTIGTIRDVTERKQFEQALRASETRYRQLFETSLDLIVVTDTKGTFVGVSPSVTALLGYDADALLGRSAAEIIHPDDLDNTRNEMRKARRSGIAQNFECRYIGEQGQSVTLWWKGNWFETNRQYVFMGRDITERALAEQRIQVQLQHLHLLDHITRAIGERQDLRSIFQVVVRTLEDSLPIDFGCIWVCDPAADALQLACMSAKSGAPTLTEDTALGVDNNGLRCCIAGQLVYEPSIGELRFPFPQLLARSGFGSLVLAPLRLENRVFGVLAAARRADHAFTSTECEFLRQLSEHVALAAQQAQLYGALHQAYDDLRQTQEAMLQEERLRALGQMASGIAHDINNALSPVSIYTESLLEDEPNLSGRARGHLQTIQRAVEDVTETVARMREFYRQREPQLDLVPVELNRMAEQVLDLTRARWSDMPQQRGVTIRALTELAADLPQIMGVESEIREALTNLVLNAVDAMPQGGMLTLRTTLAAAAESRAVVLAVSDSGIGMDEETRQRCLEPFFTTKGERGTGLGLAMVFGMVRRHGADIEIDSAPDAGTTVRLIFPAVSAAAAARIGEPIAVPTIAGLRLLLIDDDPILLKSLCDALEGDGHMVVAANGGDKGVATLRASLDRGEYFAAVITDLGMPHVDGRRVAAAVKASSPGTPVILLTGWGRQLIAEGDPPPHVDRVLAKPPRLRELRDALLQVCRRAS